MNSEETIQSLWFTGKARLVRKMLLLRNLLQVTRWKHFRKRQGHWLKIQLSWIPKCETVLQSEGAKQWFFLHLSRGRQLHTETYCKNYFTSTTTSRSQYSSSWSTVKQYVSTYTTRVVLALFWSVLQYTARNTELVVRSAKKMMSQHFKMCTKSTTHMHSFIYSIHQYVYAVLCDMRTEVGSSCALKQWTMWWCEQCECCTWILKKSHKCQIRRYNIWLTGLKNLKVIQEMLNTSCRQGNSEIRKQFSWNLRSGKKRKVFQMYYSLSSELREQCS